MKAKQTFEEYLRKGNLSEKKRNDIGKARDFCPGLFYNKWKLYLYYQKAYIIPSPKKALLYSIPNAIPIQMIT